MTVVNISENFPVKQDNNNLNIYNKEDYDQIRTIIKGHEEESIRLLIESNDPNRKPVIDPTNINHIIDKSNAQGKKYHNDNKNNNQDQKNNNNHNKNNSDDSNEDKVIVRNKVNEITKENDITNTEKNVLNINQDENGKIIETNNDGSSSSVTSGTGSNNDSNSGPQMPNVASNQS